MEKELEALDRLVQNVFNSCDSDEVLKDYETIKQALTELKSIKEAKPSEALKQVTYLSAILPDWQRVNNGVDSLSVIKQALLKAQKQEKELEKYKKVWEIVKEKPQAELSLIQLRKIKTYEEYLSYTDLWDLDEYGDLVYTEEEFKLIKEVL